MSASPTSSPLSQTAEQRAHEPSMEEILASIRKIIADDQVLPLSKPMAARPAAPAASLPSEPEPESYEDYPASSPDQSASAPDLQKSASVSSAMSELESAFAELRPSFAATAAPELARAPEEPPAPPRPAPKVEAPRAPAPEETALVSAATGASVSSAFNALATTMFLQNTGMVEEAVRDMVRPMLKQWLDDNLPALVERLVRAEIERVARGGR